MDGRTIWAILLMMTIAIVPAIFIKRPPAGGAAGQRGSGADSSARSSSVAPADSVTIPRDSASKGAAAAQPRSPSAQGAPASADHIIHVTSPLYRYGISTRGGRLVEATLPHYRSMAPA